MAKVSAFDGANHDALHEIFLQEGIDTDDRQRGDHYSRVGDHDDPVFYHLYHGLEPLGGLGIGSHGIGGSGSGCQQNLPQIDSQGILGSVRQEDHGIVQTLLAVHRLPDWFHSLTHRAKS